MALDSRYFTAISLGEYFVDNSTGLPLSGGTIEFWVDSSRSTPKPVYQLSGSPPNYTYTEVVNPITLSPVGTVVNGDEPPVNIAIYYYPYDSLGNLELYYVVVKDSDGNIQFTREAHPNVTAADDPSQDITSVSNEISNSQFVDVFFNTTYGSVIDIVGAVSNAVYSIAPNWDLVVSTNGNATVTLNRTNVAGSQGLPTNPPYTLDILAGGGNLSSLYLRQRLNHNPSIWASQFLAGYMVISSLDGSIHTISMLYAPSVAPAQTTIVTGTTQITGYQELSNTIQLDPATNTDTSEVGYVDILIQLPVSGNYNITSVQLTPLATNVEDIPYEQETVNRQKDHLFNYYNPLLQYKPIPSYLIGWNFPFNPAQFGTTGTLGNWGNRTSAYIWDQTIVYQSVTNSVSYTRNTGDNGLALSANATTQFAVIQYLPTSEKTDVLLQKLSVFLQAYSNQAGGIIGTVSLWYTNDAIPDLKSPNYESLVLTLDAKGKPTTFNGSWIEVPRKGLGDANFVLGNTPYTEVGFTGWFLDNFSLPYAATFFAIVVGFEEMTAGQYVYLRNIGLTPGEIPTIAPPITPNLSLLQCQQFYEKSYADSFTAGTVTTTNAIYQTLAPANINSIYLHTMSIPMKAAKWISGGDLVLYTAAGATDSIQFDFYEAGVPVLLYRPPITPVSTNFTINVGTNLAYLLPNNTTIIASHSGAPAYTEQIAVFHYTLNARIGFF